MYVCTHQHTNKLLHGKNKNKQTKNHNTKGQKTNSNLGKISATHDR